MTAQVFEFWPVTGVLWFEFWAPYLGEVTAVLGIQGMNQQLEDITLHLSVPLCLSNKIYTQINKYFLKSE